MEETKRLRFKDFFCGVVLSFIFFCIFFAISAVVYSEMGKPILALNLMVVLSAVSTVFYAAFEFFVFWRTGSSSFAVGYFGMTVFFSALVFFSATVFSLDLLFDPEALYDSEFIKLAWVRFSIFNAAALVVRLGCETASYLKKVFSGNP